MRTLLLTTALVLLCANPTHAQKVGDRIVVKAKTANLKMLDELIGCVPKGTVLTVREVDGNWFWVMNSRVNAENKGWIKRTDVVPLEMARDLLNDELRRKPTAELFVLRGTICDELADYDKAISDYTKALRLDPEYAAAYHCRGYAWARKGDDDQAIADYTEFIRRDPTDEAAFYNRGNAWFRKGDYDKAIVDYSESIRIDPSDGLAYISRGQAWTEKGEHEKASDDYAKSGRVDLDPWSILTAIEIEGNKQIKTDEILKLIKTRPGGKLDPKQIKEDLRALIAKRWFFNVEIRIAQSKPGPGKVLVFRVIERPTLEKISYIGNERITETTLNETTWLKVHAGYDVSANYEAVQRILTLYQEQGYPLVDVKLEKGNSPDDREVVFRIDEGTRLKIRKIAFEGNQILAAEKLQERLKVRPNAVCDHRSVLADREKILVQYAVLGRIHAKVEPTRRTFVDEPDEVDLVYKIDEGRHYDISEMGPAIPETQVAASGTLRKKAVENSVAEHPGLRNIDWLIFEGVKTLDVDEIRESLSQDFDVALSAHPDRPLSNFLDTLKEQIQAGFLHSGFPDVAVKVAANGETGRIVVSVTEGRRCVCGDIKFVGAKNLPVETLIHSLTEDPKPVRILWKIGGPAPCDEFTITLIRERLEERAREAGFLSSKFDVQIGLEPNQDTAKLVVTVSEEGLPAVVGQIDVTGAQRDSTDDLLKYLDLRPGMAFDSLLPYRLEQQLWKSGRFLTMDVTATESDSPVTDPLHEIRNLHIKLREYADAPKLANHLSPADQALVKLGEWLDRWSKGEIEEDLVVTASFASDLPFVGATKMTARMVVAPNRGQTIVVNAMGGDGKPTLDLAFAAYPDRLVLAAPLRHAKLVLPNSAEDRLVFNASGGSASARAIDRGDQVFRLNFGMGWSGHKKVNPSAFEVKANFTSACLMSFAHQDESKCELREGNWVIRTDTIELQVEAASGRLVSLRFLETGEGWSGSIRGEKDALKSELQQLEGPLAAAAVAYDAASPWKSLLEFFLDAWLDVANGHSSAEDVKSLRALRKLVGHWSPPAIADLFEWDKPPRNPEDPFWIPSHLSPISYDGCLQRASMSRKNLVGHAALPIYRRLLPKTSWLWPAGRDALLTWASDDVMSLASLHGQIESTEAGPAGEWVLATIAPYLGLDLRESTGLAGIKRLAAEAFRRDYRPLLAGDSWLGRWFLSLARALRSLDESEIRALGRFLPDGAPCDSALACMTLLKNDSSQSLEQALSAALDRYWSEELRTMLSARLRTLATVAIAERIGAHRDDRVRPASAEVEAEEEVTPQGQTPGDAEPDPDENLYLPDVPESVP